MTQPAQVSAEQPLATRHRRSLVFLAVAVAGAGFAMALQVGLNANFLAQTIGISGFQVGMLEAVRESCGILALGVLALVTGLAEPLVAAGMLLLLAAGLASYALVKTYTWVVLMSVVWSMGLHVWMPLPNSMALALAEPGRAGRRLGQMGAAGSAGFAIGLAAALVLTLASVPLRPLYLLAGAGGCIAAGACLGINRRLKTPGPRFVLRRRYALYYALSFLEGWRKQIFLCFAGFLLVRRYETSLTTMLVLWIVSQVAAYLAAPSVGRLIDRVGERPVLVAYFTSLIFVFIGYALIDSAAVLYVLFAADNALFVLAMALTSYVSRVAPPGEHTPTLSMGVAMNHVAAVAMPFLGAIMWAYMGYRWPFLMGALAAVLSVAVALRVPPKR